MIKLKRILQELNYGNTLFGDPYSDGFWKDTSEDAYEEFLQSIGVEEESNTMEEESLFLVLAEYLKAPHNTKNLGELKELLPLKSKFPLILDPLQDREVDNDGYVYRGATVDTKDLVALVKAAKLDWSKIDVSDFASISANGKEVNSSSQRGALSFTFKRRTAETFATSNEKTELSSEDLARRYPVVLQCNVNTVKDKLLFTPSFLDAISGYGENETFYFDTKIPCDKILIAPPMAFTNLGSPSDLEDKFEDDLPPILWDFLRATNYL
jgi:hypothetical protein